MNSLNHPLIHIPHREAVERKINSFSLSRTQIVTDYDATMTRADGEHSWSIFENKATFSEGYAKEAKALFAKNHPFEIDDTLSPEVRNRIMQQWWEDSLSLLIKYKLHASDLNEILSRPHAMEFRVGFGQLLAQSSTHGIPVTIFSAGIGNVIEKFLILQKRLSPNLHIVSNRLRF